MGAGSGQQFDGVFAKVKARFDEQSRGGLICKQGFYDACWVLKLQKASWTNDSMDQVRNESGIFFSVWVNEASARINRANYNIHALKLRQLKGYAIASREFAADFRRRFAPMRSPWPNVSLDYGPQTLMQGWLGTKADTLQEDLSALMERFTMVSPLIDKLLAARRQ